MTDFILETKQLTRTYGDVNAVEDLNLGVKQGEILGFLGPNGAGKTTSIQMICGLVKPTRGEVLIHGKKVRNGDRQLLASLGICPQDLVLWKRLTCREQLMFVAHLYGVHGTEARIRTEKLLSDMHLTEKANKLANTLSGGMKRRLNFLMALVHDPQIVVLDEPEAGLDPQSRVLVREYIRSLAGEKTVVLTSHNMDEVERLADRVAIMDQGKLLCLDTPQELKNRSGSQDVIEVEVRNGADGQLEVVALRLREKGCKVEVHGKLLLVYTSENGTDLEKVVESLKAEEVYAHEIRLRKNSLEDVFLKLTGRSLRE